MQRHDSDAVLLLAQRFSRVIHLLSITNLLIGSTKIHQCRSGQSLQFPHGWLRLLLLFLNRGVFSTSGKCFLNSMSLDSSQRSFPKPSFNSIKQVKATKFFTNHKILLLAVSFPNIVHSIFSIFRVCSGTASPAAPT